MVIERDVMSSRSFFWVIEHRWYVQYPTQDPRCPHRQQTQSFRGLCAPPLWRFQSPHSIKWIQCSFSVLTVVPIRKWISLGRDVSGKWTPWAHAPIILAPPLIPPFLVANNSIKVPISPASIIVASTRYSPLSYGNVLLSPGRALFLNSDDVLTPFGTNFSKVFDEYNLLCKKDKRSFVCYESLYFF